MSKKYDFSKEDNSKYSDSDLQREAQGETGFTIDIEYNCPHQVGNMADLTMSQIKAAFEGPCCKCDVDDENWLCMQCGAVFCSRYRNGHMKEHNVGQGHQIAVSLTDLSFWCFACSSYIESAHTRKARFVLSSVKFGELIVKPTALQQQQHQQQQQQQQEQKNMRNKPKGSTSHATMEEVEEHFDKTEKVEQDAREVAKCVKSSKHVVVYTGAGISTSTGIPDYRGPKGCWTLRDQGLAPQGVDIEQACPAFGHYALKCLVDRGLVHYIVSTNVDGLHRRSGVPEHKIAELHGNCYREVCQSCKKEHLRAFDVTRTVKDFRTHVTGRTCECGSKLLDTIVHFGEDLPARELEQSIKHSEMADLVLVLGTSMRVAPASKLPLMSVAKGGKMVIVNLQLTPYDKKCHVRSFSKTDQFLALVLKELGIDQVDQSFDALVGKH